MRPKLKRICDSCGKEKIPLVVNKDKPICPECVNKSINKYLSDNKINNGQSKNIFSFRYIRKPINI